MKSEALTGKYLSGLFPILKQPSKKGMLYSLVLLILIYIMQSEKSKGVFELEWPKSVPCINIFSLVGKNLIVVRNNVGLLL
jgi:hypothetical protein